MFGRRGRRGGRRRAIARRRRDGRLLLMASGHVTAGQACSQQDYGRNRRQGAHVVLLDFLLPDPRKAGPPILGQAGPSGLFMFKRQLIRLLT
jgi:hypothetical protein